MKATATKAKTTRSTASTKETSKTASKTATRTPAKTTRGIVKPKRTAAEGLRELFVDSLKDIYWAEKALTKALAKMAKNATADELAKAIEDHLVQTETHVTRLEQVFASIGEKAVAKKCDAMDGLIKEGEGIMEETEVGAVRDAGIISAAQKVEHYEIATYGTLRVFADILGESEARDILSQTLEEEKSTDTMLTQIAEAVINIEAAQADEK
jgi:ferritin-like metal-binding protein YciE